MNASIPSVGDPKQQICYQALAARKCQSLMGATSVALLSLLSHDSPVDLVPGFFYRPQMLTSVFFYGRLEFPPLCCESAFANCAKTRFGGLASETYPTAISFVVKLMARHKPSGYVVFADPKQQICYQPLEIELVRHPIWQFFRIRHHHQTVG